LEIFTFSFHFIFFSSPFFHFTFPNFSSVAPLTLGLKGFHDFFTRKYWSSAIFFFFFLHFFLRFGGFFFKISIDFSPSPSLSLFLLFLLLFSLDRSLPM